MITGEPALRRVCGAGLAFILAAQWQTIPALAQDAEVPDAPALESIPAPIPDETETAYPRFIPGARLVAGAELHKAHPSSEQIAENNRQSFFLEQARVELTIEANKQLEATFSAELTDDPSVRDAYVNVRLKRAFQLRAGQFKRPISRIENTGMGKLPLRNRGLFNDLLIEDAQWGDRAVGLMLWGNLKAASVKWYAGAFNSASSINVSALEQIRGADFLGRIEYEPTEWLSFGVNGGHKDTEPYVNGPNRGLVAFGGDARVRVSGLNLVLESMAAQNPAPPLPRPAGERAPFAAVVLGYATYDFALTDGLSLQPTLAGEWLDTDIEFSQDEVLRTVLGINLLAFDGALRLMPQVEIIRPLHHVGARSHVKSETYYLVLVAEL
jgi:hypothetical protein